MEHEHHDMKNMPLMNHDEHQEHQDQMMKGMHGEGHDMAANNKHAGHSLAMFSQRFWICLILTLPIIYFSDFFQKYFNYSPITFFGSNYLSSILGTIIFFYGGWVFIKGAIRELKSRLPGMMILIALAISVAYIFSIAFIFINIGDPLWWELSTLITIMLLGHWLEMRSVQGAQSALKDLAKLLPDTAERIKPDGGIEKIPTSDLRVSDVVLVRPGTNIPVDGKVIEGKSEVNEAMITGESRPVTKEKDTEVIAGTININGALKIKITKIGEQTFLSGMMRLIAEAEQSKSKTQILSDRAAYYLTIIAISSGVITFIAWLEAKETIGFAIERSVTVLVIACPHALGLAVPLVAAISTALAARSGFLVRKRIALESARNIDIVLFDKTGTLTKGEMGVTDIRAGQDTKLESEIIKIAASLEQNSEHSLAKAIVNKAKENKIPLDKTDDFKAIPGFGVEGVIDGKKYYLGNIALLEKNGLNPKIKNLGSKTHELEIQGKSVVILASEKEVIGTIAIADIVKPESKEAVSNLAKMGIDVAMITGDAKEVAKYVAKELDIETYFARVLPKEKSSKVKELQKGGKKVAMVGDGINDAPALIQSDLGVAIGAGTNVAIESAGIILVKNDPRDIVKIIRLSRATYSKMVQNIFWATGYNVVAIPLAAGVLASRGILLQPAVGAILMSLSTIIVAFNALLLRRMNNK